MINSGGLNQIAINWLHFLGTHTADTTWIFFIAGLTWLLCRKKAPAQFGYYLFMLVLIKAIVPYQLAMPLPQISLFEKMEKLYYSSKTDHSIANQPAIEKPEIPTQIQEKQYDTGKKAVLNNIMHTDIQTKNNEIIKKNETIKKVLAAQPAEKKISKQANKTGNFDKSTIVKNSGDVPQQNRVLLSNDIPAASVSRADAPIVQPVNKPSYFTTATDTLFKIIHYLTAFPLYTIIFAGWFLIVSGLIIRLLFTFKYINRITSEAMEVDPDAVSPNFQGLLFISRIRRQVRVMISPLVESPFVCGAFNPVLLLPIDFMEKYNANQIRWILLHELAHIQRWDALVRLIQEIIQIIYFFHPAVWIANRMINQLREFACDDDAILCSNLSRHDCGESFLHVVFQSNRAQIPVPGLIGISNSKQIIKERLMRILDQKRTLYLRVPVHLTGFLILFALAILPFSGFVNAQNSPAPIPAAKEATDVTVKDATFTYAKAASTAVNSTASFSTSETTTATSSISETTAVDEDGKKVQKLQIPREKSGTIDLITRDGSIAVEPQSDSFRLGFIDVVAEIMVSNKEDGDGLPEAEFNAVKEKITVIADRNNQDGRIIVRPDIPQNVQNRINVEINLKAQIPPAIGVKTISANGNTTIAGMKGSVESKTSDGDLELVFCTGEISTITQNGSQKLSNCSGTIITKSADGDIEILDCGSEEAYAKKSITVVSQNGDVKIINGVGTITAKSSDGDIQIQNCNTEKSSTEEPVTIISQNGDIHLDSCKGVFTLKSSDGDIEINNCSGLISAVSDEAKEKAAFSLISQNGDVKLENCIGTINVKSMDGDIEIQQNKGAVTALSGDGEINIQDAVSQVNATTGDGSITVSFTCSPEKDCSFKTNDGEINVTLPGDSKFNIDLQSGDGEIEFDREIFKGQAEEHHVQGTLNGGGPVIHARTGDGKISIQHD